MHVLNNLTPSAWTIPERVKEKESEREKKNERENEKLREWLRKCEKIKKYLYIMSAAFWTVFFWFKRNFFLFERESFWQLAVSLIFCQLFWDTVCWLSHEKPMVKIPPTGKIPYINLTVTAIENRKINIWRVKKKRFVKIMLNVSLTTDIWIQTSDSADIPRTSSIWVWFLKEWYLLGSLPWST